MISIIVAIAKNYAIGKGGDLLCHLPNDLKHFKALTEGHTVLMGERTFLSLPKRPLPNRRNIVLTDKPGKTFEGAEAVYSLDEAIHVLRASEDECFVIGGGMVYQQLFEYADKLYITHIYNTWDDADTFFPRIKNEDWCLIAIEKYPADEQHPYEYDFAEYIRQ
ncbi:MAG: dihydrofolate reductase [Paludibacteraceae bacterium]|nr:dihydrofolate reductase [Paludibacteraceae bacterium]